MSFAQRNNLPELTYQTPSDLPFVSLHQLVEDHDIDQVYHLRTLLLNDKGDYGDQYVAVIDGYKVNLPTHMTRKIAPLLRDKRSVREINEGKVGFRVEAYENEHGAFFTIKWVDVKPTDPAEKPTPAVVI